ncbi:MAG TPA: SHOCT domain-containing protein [Agromyces sp.]|nr:SHOCT domain-containing protein [Agromyces sp.]
MMWDYGYYGMWWMWIPGLLLALLIIGGIAALIVMAVRSTGSSTRPPDTTPPNTDPARRILEERLARGEITPEQYRELRSTLDEDRRL